MQTDSLSVPWAQQLEPSEPSSWSSGVPIMILCAILWLWVNSLAVRFLEPELRLAAFLITGGLAIWFFLQVTLMRRGIIERGARGFSSILQAVIPTVVIAAWVRGSDMGYTAALSIAQQVTVLELVGLHGLRLAAWGTVKKYQEGQLPRYFFLFGSVPDFGFAVGAVVLTGLIWSGVVAPSTPFLIAWSLVGMAAFLGAAVTMYFGVPRTWLSVRWAAVERAEEPPTLLPFRWPMNLAPAFCAPVFWLAHLLLIFKLVG